MLPRRCGRRMTRRKRLLLLLFSVSCLAVLLVVSLEGREAGAGMLEEECRAGAAINISSPTVVARGGGTPEACQYSRGVDLKILVLFCQICAVLVPPSVPLCLRLVLTRQHAR